MPTFVIIDRTEFFLRMFFQKGTLTALAGTLIRSITKSIHMGESPQVR